MANFDRTSRRRRYFIVITTCNTRLRNPSSVGIGATRCPPPPNNLTVTLNSDVVFTTAADVPSRRQVSLPASALHAHDNQVVITAGGEPGSSAAVVIKGVTVNTN